MSNIINHIGCCGTDMEGTRLWENPNPMSSFAEQTVQLSDRADNYDYLRYIYKETSATTEELETWLKMVRLTGFNYVGSIIFYTNNYYFRFTATSGSSEHYFSNCNNGGVGLCIPLRVYGIKE